MGTLYFGTYSEVDTKKYLSDLNHKMLGLLRINNFSLIEAPFDHFFLKLITEVFVEKPQALPGYAEKKFYP